MRFLISGSISSPDYYVVVASEKPAIQTVFNVKHDQVNEIQAGEALIIKKSGKLIKETINNPTQKASCSFERIYFSRGSDYYIYKERKELGRRLFPKILKSISSNFENTVFSRLEDMF